MRLLNLPNMAYVAVVIERFGVFLIAVAVVQN